MRKRKVSKAEKRALSMRKQKVSKAEKRAAAKIFKAASMYLKRYGTLLT